MTAPFGLNEADEMDELDESDEALDEAVRTRGTNGRRPPVRTAPRQSAFRPPTRPTNEFVSQPQLQAALARVTAQISTNSTAIKTVDSRVRALSSEQVRVTAALRKEIAERKKEGTALRGEVQSAKELAVILPLIAKDNPLIGLLALGGGSLFGGAAPGPDGTTQGGIGGSSTSNVVFLALALGGLGRRTTT